MTGRIDSYLISAAFCSVCYLSIMGVVIVVVVVKVHNDIIYL